ncbi:hypothetical protein [Actinokineospora diospyrosa]|uniref:Uncharacterized protein n=1 Tax=Actinokineospora diospyrosa TaxID=103728 RepID=A0ABT1IAY1_9PSEU|nr:hypothetical protein [Actinokineospora diospyrosa]MCP2269718.1 hypothetical protein [Actinokineospora diospyrosa]
MTRIALGLVLVLLAGCGGATSPPRPTPTSATYPEVQAPKDRDVSALEQVDACALVGKPPGVDRERCAADGHVSVVVGERFGREKRYRAKVVEFGGVRGFELVDAVIGRCQVAVPVSFDLAVVVSGETCASEMAAGVAAKLGALAIPTNEPDVPLVGACVDYPYGLQCQPADDAAVPTDREAAFVRAAGDARVACAMAKDAVQQFGKMSPVIASRASEARHCFFVDQTHTVVVEVSQRIDGDLNGVVKLGDDRSTTVAGKPALVSTTSGDGYSDRRACVQVTGVLCVTAHFLPERGSTANEVARSVDPTPVLAAIIG